MRGNIVGLWWLACLALLYWFIRLAMNVPKELGRLNNTKVFQPHLYNVELGAYLFTWVIWLFLTLIVLGPYFYIKYAYR